MEEVKLTKEQEILFEVYDKGVQNKDCDLDAYVEKMKQALSIAFVSQQRELLLAYEEFTSYKVLGKKTPRISKQMVEDFLANNCG